MRLNIFFIKSYFSKIELNKYLTPSLTIIHIAIWKTRSDSYSINRKKRWKLGKEGKQTRKLQKKIFN